MNTLESDPAFIFLRAKIDFICGQIDQLPSPVDPAIIDELRNNFGKLRAIRDWHEKKKVQI